MIIMLIPILSVFWLHTLSPVQAAQAATRDNIGCSFHLSCSGGFNGSIGQKGSGQINSGSGGSPSLFTWFGDAFADQQGSGCWWTPPTLTLQCDRNQTPDHGFQIGCDGLLSFGGQSVFYECATGQGNEINIYLQPSGDQCHQITILADDCSPSTCPGGTVLPSPSMPASSSSTPTSSSTSSGPLIPSPFTTGNDQTTTTSLTSTSVVTTTQPAPSSTTTGCTTAVPDQIILTDKGNPNTGYGPNYNRIIQVSPNASSIFNFFFDDSDMGKTCELAFMLPNSSTDANGTPYIINGTGVVTFAALDGRANANTTFNTTPNVIEAIANGLVERGMNQSFGRFECPGSTSQTSIILAEGPMADSCLECMQGAPGDGIGMYLYKC